MLEEIVRTLNQVGFVPCFGLLCRGIGGVQMSSVCAIICYKLERTYVGCVVLCWPMWLKLLLTRIFNKF